MVIFYSKPLKIGSYWFYVPSAPCFMVKSDGFRWGSSPALPMPPINARNVGCNELGDQRGKNEARKRGDKFREIYLVGGLEHFLFFPCIGNNMTNIFQRGGNHQPAKDKTMNSTSTMIPIVHQDWFHWISLNGKWFFPAPFAWTKKHVSWWNTTVSWQTAG